MKVRPLQTSFSGGQVSKRMQARSDVDGFKHAFKEGVNWIVYPHGPAELRKGLKHIYSLSGNSTVGRIIPFAITSTLAFVVVITKDTIRIFDASDDSSSSLASAYTTDAQVSAIHYGHPPGEDRVVLVNGVMAPRYLDYGSPFTTGTLTFTDQPASWTGSIYPRTVGFANGRAWYANISGDIERFWASKSGSFYAMDASGTGADRAIDRTIDKRGAIQWIAKGKELTFGAETGVYHVTSSEGVITADDIKVSLEVSQGSAFIQPEVVGEAILYISPDGRKVREFKYDFNSGGYLAKDKTFIAEDITEGNPITRMCYAEDPDSFLWHVCSGGGFIGATYDTNNNNVGWHEHAATRDVVDVCSVKYNGTNQTWFLVDAGTHLDVVKIGDQYMDFYSEQTAGASTTSVGPFVHLQGEEVHVLVDGANDGKITLNTAGNGTTTTAGLEFVVGKSYEEAYFSSLNLDPGHPRGSAAGMLKRWSKLFVHISESAIPIINGNRPPTRSAQTDMGDVEELITEYVQVPTRGFSREGTVTISQDLPLKTTVLAFLGELKEN